MLRGCLKRLRPNCIPALRWSCQTSHGPGATRHGIVPTLSMTRAISTSCSQLGTVCAEKKMQLPETEWQPTPSGHWWRLESHLRSSQGSLPLKSKHGQGWWLVGLFGFAVLAIDVAQVACAPRLWPMEKPVTKASSAQHEERGKPGSSVMCRARRCRQRTTPRETNPIIVVKSYPTEAPHSQRQYQTGSGEKDGADTMAGASGRRVCKACVLQRGTWIPLSRHTVGD